MHFHYWQLATVAAQQDDYDCNELVNEYSLLKVQNEVLHQKHDAEISDLDEKLAQLQKQIDDLMMVFNNHAKEVDVKIEQAIG